MVCCTPEREVLVSGKRTRARVGVVALLAIASSLLTVGAAEASPGQDRSGPRLTVMTQNLYLGSPLDPALDPSVDTPAEFVAAVARIYGTALLTDFPTRAEVIADTIAAEQPDLIGLQEVTDWVAAPTRPGPTPPSQDFLEILMAALEERGLDYDVAAVANNADIGPAPLVAPQFGCGVTATDCVVTLKDRDVILVNDDTPALHWSDPRSGRYAAQQTFTPPGSPPVSFARGWATVEGKYRGERFRFANTHLEVASFPAVQEAQAREFLAGPASSQDAVIAVGDFNSAADGSTTGSYDLLTGVLTDAWGVNPGDPGFTSGQNGTLSNPTSLLDQRIDLILTRSSARTQVRALEAHVVGDTPFQQAVPRWPSDHAGVVATLALR
jgi:endonuclease/exonuclease/phosphatase family metal-dependent hydrolase